MAAPTIPARPTVYKGIQMRSRLEAEFAQFLDSLGWAWEYEPGCFADETGQYLPDFVTLAEGQPNLVYIEVKGAEPEDIDAVQRRMEIIWSSEPTAWLCLTVDALNRNYVAEGKGHPWEILP